MNDLDIGRGPFLNGIGDAVRPSTRPLVPGDLARLVKLDVRDLVPQTRKPPCLCVCYVGAGQAYASRVLGIRLALHFAVSVSLALG